MGWGRCQLIWCVQVRGGEERAASTREPVPHLAAYSTPMRRRVFNSASTEVLLDDVKDRFGLSMNP